MWSMTKNDGGSAERRQRRIQGAELAAGLVAFGGGLALFVPLATRVDTDIRTHAIFIQDAVASGGVLLIPNFLYYLTVWLTALCSRDLNTILLASAIVLAASLALKCAVSYRISVSMLGPRWSAAKPGFILVSLCLLLLFGHSIPVANNTRSVMYMGYMPPNVWHNSTTIFVMAPALLLFWYSYRYLVRPCGRYAAAIVALSLANIVAKPNYFFVFAVVFPISAWRKLGTRNGLGNALTLLLPGVLLLGIEYYLIYRSGNVYETFYRARDAASSSAIGFRLCVFWRQFWVRPPLSFLSSVLFPLAFAALCFREASASLLLRYAWLSMAVAFVISCVITETGPRELHGNFIWQTIICNYMLWLATLIALVDAVARKGRFDWRTKVVAAVFCLHVLSGFCYQGKIFVTGSYW